MTALRPHTKLYEKDARDRLGLAVIRAREAAGYPFRPAFAKAAGIGPTSLYKLEAGDPVGPTVYEAVARALPTWTEDDPRNILDGGPVPPNEPTADDSAEPDAPLLADWTEEDERRYRVVKDMLRSQGLEMTPHTLRIMRDEYERLQATERERSYEDS